MTETKKPKPKPGDKDYFTEPIELSEHEEEWAWGP